MNLVNTFWRSGPSSMSKIPTIRFLIGSKTILDADRKSLLRWMTESTDYKHLRFNRSILDLDGLAGHSRVVKCVEFP